MAVHSFSSPTTTASVAAPERARRRARSGVADVLVVAPERQRSAASYAITLHKPLRLTEVRPGRFAIQHAGRLRVPRRAAPGIAPAGPGRLGDQRRLQPRQRRLLLGHGCRGGRGALRGRSGIALSIAPAISPIAAIEVAAPRRARRAGRTRLPAGTVLNVNMPGQSPARSGRGWGAGTTRTTCTSARSARSSVLLGQRRRQRPHDIVEGSDCSAIAHGLTSITPMHLDLTARDLLRAAVRPSRL